MADSGLYNLLVNIRASVAELQRDMDQAVGVLNRATGRMDSVMRGFYEGIGKNLADAAIQGVVKFSAALNQLADKGEIAGSIADNFEKLGGSVSSIENARKAVLGTVSAFDLMKVANEGIARGIPNLNKNFATLAEYAGRFADATGRDTLEVLQQLTKAVSTGSNKALQEFGIQVDSAASRSEKMRQAIEQLSANMEKFAPLTDSVSNAHASLGKALDDVGSKVGIGINNNEQLAQAYRDLEQAINSIDWQQVGADIASMVASIIGALPNLQWAAEQTASIAQTIRSITGNDTKADRMNLVGSQLQAEIKELEKEIALRKGGATAASRPILPGKGGQLIDSVLGTEISGYDAKKTAELEAQLKSKQQYLALAQKELATEKEADALRRMNLGVYPSDPRSQGLRYDKKTGGWVDAQSLFSSGGGGGGGSDKAAKEIDRLKEKWGELTDKVETDSLKKAVEGSIDTVNTSVFGALKDQLQKQIEDAWVDGHKEFLKAGISEGDLRAMAAKEAQAQVDEYQKKMDAASAKQAEKLADAQLKAQEQARERSIEVWSDVFGTAFEKLGLDPRLADAAAKFASEFMSGLAAGGQGNQGGVYGFGQSIAKGIADAFGGIFGVDTFNMSTEEAHQQGIQGPSMQNGMFSEATNVAASYFGSGMTTQQAHSAGIQGPGMADGSFGGSSSSGGMSAESYAAAANAAIGVMEVLKKDYGPGKNAQGQQVKDAIHVVGMAVANAWTFGLASVVETLVGRENMEKLSIGVRIIDAIFGENSETTARKAFDRWIEGVLKDKNVSFFGADGKPSKFGGNIETQKFTETFNKPGWADAFTKTESFPVFDALGKSLADLLGIAEDIGGQIGFILSQNLNGNVNNARRLVKALGLSFEEVEKKLVEIGLKGEKTWLEIETQLQGVAEAFKPGLVEIGAFGLAMENLLASGAKGFEAVQSIRDIFVEASEAGIKDFETLRQQLLKTFDPKTVDAFFAALNQRGVTSIEAGIKLDDRTAGGIVADMQAAGVKFTDAANSINDAIEGQKDAVNDNTSAIRDLTSQIGQLGGRPLAEDELPPTDVAPEEGMASGGMVFGPRRTLMGEHGPEAILPLTRRNGRLGIAAYGIQGNAGGGYVVNVYAPNAAPGMEKAIRQSIRGSQRQVMAMVGKSMRDSRRTT